MEPIIRAANPARVEELSGLRDGGHHALITLWHAPSFEPHKQWTLFESRAPNGEKVMVREVTRELAGELACPTLRYALIPSRKVQAALRELAARPIPLIDGHFGIDGETFGFAIGYQGVTSLHIEWWGDGPAAWNAVTTWARRLMDELKKRIASHGSQCSPWAEQRRMLVLCGPVERGRAEKALRQLYDLPQDLVGRITEALFTGHPEIEGWESEIQKVASRLQGQGIRTELRPVNPKS